MARPKPISNRRFMDKLTSPLNNLDDGIFQQDSWLQRMEFKAACCHVWFGHCHSFILPYSFSHKKEKSRLYIFLCTSHHFIFCQIFSNGSARHSSFNVDASFSIVFPQRNKRIKGQLYPFRTFLRIGIAVQNYRWVFDPVDNLFMACLGSFLQLKNTIKKEKHEISSVDFYRNIDSFTLVCSHNCQTGFTILETSNRLSCFNPHRFCIGISFISPGYSLLASPDCTQVKCLFPIFYIWNILFEQI